MSNDTPEQRSLKLLNESGFPFQIGVREEINRTSGTHGWKIVAEEHPWTRRTGAYSGFADLVLRHENDAVFRAVIECKRVKEDGRWIFLIPHDRAGSVQRTSFFWSGHGENYMERSGWIDLTFNPASPQAAFCTIHGQDDTKRPMLEGIADQLLPATEAIGLEEQRVVNSWNYGPSYNHLYVPIVVTNATLTTATFDAGRVGMNNGRLVLEDCEFAEVPCVRFRKGLRGDSPTLDPQHIYKGDENVLGALNRSGERTIVIVNSVSIAEMLRQLRLPPEATWEFNTKIAQLRMPQ
jgi:hypothetical protein